MCCYDVLLYLLSHFSYQQIVLSKDSLGHFQGKHPSIILSLKHGRFHTNTYILSLTHLPHHRSFNGIHCLTIILSRRLLIQEFGPLIESSPLVPLMDPFEEKHLHWVKDSAKQVRDTTYSSKTLTHLINGSCHL